jgi:hypothetical protein
VHTLLSGHADKVYECAPDPSSVGTLRQLLMELGPADEEGSGRSLEASTYADWTPETTCARVVAVKEALLRRVAREPAAPSAAEPTAASPAPTAKPRRQRQTPSSRMPGASDADAEVELVAGSEEADPSELRAALHRALAENEALARRVQTAEAALHTTTAEVL